MAKIRIVAILSGVLAQSTAMPAQEKPQLPEAPGKAATQRICSTCHGVQIVLGKPHSEDGWSAIVADMVQRGAQGTDEEFYEVVQYLTRNIKAGPARINVNKASAKALEAALEIPAKQAEAIVGAREKSDFKSVEDLKKVPGIDGSKIEAKKNSIVF